MSPTQWSTPTECTLWDVRAMAAHLVGSAASQASLREFLRQKRAGKPICKELGSPFWWDGMNELQVRERASATTEQLISEWATVSPTQKRRRTGSRRALLLEKMRATFARLSTQRRSRSRSTTIAGRRPDNTECSAWAELAHRFRGIVGDTACRSVRRVLERWCVTVCQIRLVGVGFVSATLMRMAGSIDPAGLADVSLHAAPESLTTSPPW